MYIKAAEYKARLEKIASSSCLPTHRMQNAMLYGDAGAEFYEPEHWNNRALLRRLRDEVIAERRATQDRSRCVDLLKVERGIDRALAAGKLLRPEPTKTFSQCFMDAAETTLNQAVFQKIKAIALVKYGNDLRRTNSAIQEEPTQ